MNLLRITMFCARAPTHFKQRLLPCPSFNAAIAGSITASPSFPHCNHRREFGVLAYGLPSGPCRTDTTPTHPPNKPITSSNTPPAIGPSTGRCRVFCCCCFHAPSTNGKACFKTTGGACNHPGLFIGQASTPPLNSDPRFSPFPHLPHSTFDPQQR